MPSPNVNKASDRSNRSRLLHAAGDAFSQLGFEGTSLRTIADDAGVSFQLINHYFGSKEELWIATLDYLFERYLETGRGLGFTPTANLHEQFHNHLRLLMTDQFQRPQLRRICIQEYLANSSRYEKFIQPKIKHFHETLAHPYYRDLVRLGIVKRFTAQEVALIFSSVVQNNLAFPYYVELLLGIPTGTAKSIERQVDLVYEILVADPDPADEAAGTSIGEPRGDDAADGATAVVYAWDNAQQLTPDGNRIKQLELENSRLKHLVGNLALEKQLLLDRLALLERGNAKT
jgi:AcrR family transcriptional regulator